MLQGAVQPNPGVTSNYKLELPGVGVLLATSVGELEQELVIFTAPDRTQHSAGQVNPGETEITTLAHHNAEHALVNAWWIQSKTSTDGYKRTATLQILAANGRVVRTVEILGCFPRKVATPAVSTSEDGETYQFTWTLAYDSIGLL